MSVTFGIAALDLGVVVAFALTAILLRAIDSRGFLASFAVGYAILVGGGPSWFVIVAVFFVLGVSVTFYKYGYKKKIGGAQEKGGARNWPNILANGGLGALFAVGEFALGGTAFAALYLGSISTAAADTVATEVGLLSKGQPKLITHPRTVVPPGTSGGVTALGFIGAAVASGVIGAMAVVLGVLPSGPKVLLVCVVGGVFGAVADSVVGELVQRKGTCVICMRSTESLKHCGEKTKVTGGVGFVDNNVVNLVATGSGALAALAVAIALSV